MFISSFYVKKIEYIEKNVCGVFKYHYPKPSQRATNIELLTFNIDGYGDLTLPIERKFNMNGLNIENIKKGDRFCILIPVDKSDSNNLKTAYHILYIKIYD
ncbi:hypothetical protein [Acinetobacter sp. ANC 3813]|uniref:hypothetical protein n=1 Tax=Acinetobacter sp. ANC 3813 TaxID=1977873 RepID=UPI000A33D48A|nr:hypothetical protein [Acinetobacter sp. ANC 3813]OTG89451.1 hypothetical protein B9T34_12370 [Acinetobacter sp. ANC 3813]